MPDAAPAPAVTAPATPSPETPIPSAQTSLLAGKFKDVGELEKGYKELETKLGQRGVQIDTPKPAAPNAAPQIGDNPSPTPDEPVDVPTVLTKANLKMEDLAEQFSTKGDLTEDQYNAIRKARPGLTKADIRLIAEGMASKQALIGQAVATAVNKAAEAVGGRAQLDNLVAWASTPDAGLSPKEKAVLNAQLKDPETVGLAVETLAAKHARAMGAGKAQPLAQGGTASTTAGAKDSREFAQLVAAAQRGDSAAIAKIQATPDNVIRSWTA